MIWTIVKEALLVAWAFVLGFMVISMADRVMSPQQHFDFAVGFATVLFFAILQTAFGGSSSREKKSPTSFPPREDVPLTGCPTCHAEMHLVGVHTKQGRTPVYLWMCERDHGWCRQGEHPGDATFPWQACKPAEMMGTFFG